MIWMLIDPKGKPTEPAYYSRIDAIKAASIRNARLSDSTNCIHGEYWRVRSCAMAEA